MPFLPSRLLPSRRALGLVRLGWAAALLAVPARLVGVMGGRVDSRSVAVARILGVRHAAQGTVEVVAGSRWQRTGPMIDAAHSLSAASLAAVDASWRRIAVTDAVIAAAFALAGRAR